MSKIYLFLPDFKALVKSTSMTPESMGFNHEVFYYEDEVQIYFYKPIGSFVYCLQAWKLTEDEKETQSLVRGLAQEKIDDLKQEFKAIEVPRRLYVTHVELTTTGVETQ